MPTINYFWNNFSNDYAQELYNIPSSECAFFSSIWRCIDLGSRIEPQAGEHPPPAPELFFGRDPLVVLIANCVRQRKHVALIGPGGIGKTSIARTVIHHKVIREYFGLRCHLLSCADITVSDDSANFVNRIGKVIGAKLSSSNPLSSLRAFVSLLTSPLLLVIDNAETILDTFIGQTQIADIIDELGSSPMISLLLTTRTTVLPNNVLWTRIDVPPLDQDAAREAFFSVYNYEKPSRVVDRLLEEVDRHPLSVNLLAWAAAQNQWSVSKLESRWKHEKTRLLHPGQDVGKMRSLAISIELSINSPLMHQLGDNGRHVLQIIAFLPQGVAENQLAGLFPDVPNIELVVEALRRLSLTHHNNNFITMLAPTRLHIQNTSPHSLPLLAGVRKFYYTNLGKHGRPSPGDDNYDNGLWVASEDDNIERLLDHHFSESGQHPSACAASWYFFHYLHWHKPRKTILEPRVQSLPDSLSKWKARCLLAIGNIAFQMGRYAEASQYLTSARNIALADGNGWLATLCLTSLAGLNRDLGRLADAAVLYQQTVTWYSDEGYDFNETISIMRLGSIARRRGDFYQASKLLTQARDYYEPMRTCNFALTTTHLGFLAFDEGNYAQGRNHFNTAIASFTDLRDVGNLGWCLSAFAAMELMVDNWPKVHELIDRARDVFVKASIVGEAAGCLTEKGRAYCFQGEFDLAKEYLARAKEESVLAASATDEAECAYVSAWVEFYQRAYENATVLFLEARRLYGEIDDIAGAADCARSLGEISFLQKDYKGAEKLFAEAKLIYSESMGLYENKMDNRLEIRINEGWKLFRKGNPGRALPQDTN